MSVVEVQNYAQIPVTNGVEEYTVIELQYKKYVHYLHTPATTRA